MERRRYLKTFILGSFMPMLSGYGLSNRSKQVTKLSKASFKSDWELWGDMVWVGPQFWGNRLQDWHLKGGQLICDITARDRSLHLLTMESPEGTAPLDIEVSITVLNKGIADYKAGCIGLLLGAQGPFDDYRSAAVFGKGLAVGLTPQGQLKVGDRLYPVDSDGLPEAFTLRFTSQPKDSKNQHATIRIHNTISGNQIASVESVEIPNESLRGSFALLANIDTKRAQDMKPSVAFSNWQIHSDALHVEERNHFGPICFAQYTLDRQTLKLTAQLAPIEQIQGHKIQLQFKRNNKWHTQEETTLTHPGRAVNFKVQNWNETTDTPYRVRCILPLNNQTTHRYDYQGTIATEPVDSDVLKVGVFSCNFHFGFPDSDIHEGVSQLDPDMNVFLGDQFYEATGGFYAQYKGPFEKKCLDYLRKWMMFGWSYREIFRHKPCAIIPDDHDVYHGNVWGESGKRADLSHGFGAESQDSGGYKMPPQWVNMVQFTQTSHLPDPYDPTPVKNNIGVYYTNWNYAGVSFAILEDRKFKSASKHVLPPEAEIYNGFIKNKNFDIKTHRAIHAQLLGKRQEQFLEAWVEDWGHDVQMKSVLSQTNFAAVCTLPKDAQDDSVVPSLTVPEKGEYVQGDAPTVDMDSNGWPQNKRDKAVTVIRKGLAFHIAGDQHLGSFVQYGVDAFGDSNYAFAGPALNNIWPRRFWPPVDASKHSYNSPAYTGNHEDGFGNKITVKAIANPHNEHKKPEVLYNRANGYGLVTFNKKERTIKTACYQRFKNPLEKSGQYPGWPITIAQEDNFLSNAAVFLPELKIQSHTLPLMKVFAKDGELIYALRLPSKVYRPRVFSEGTYKITLETTQSPIKQKILRVKGRHENRKHLKINLT